MRTHQFFGGRVWLEQAGFRQNRGVGRRGHLGGDAGGHYRRIGPDPGRVRAASGPYPGRVRACKPRVMRGVSTYL